MSTSNASNGWRWIGAAILLLLLLLLWIFGLGPMQPGCCGIAAVPKHPVPLVAVASSPVNIAFKNENGRIILSGELPNEAEKHNIVNAATILFGADKVIDQLTVWKDVGLPGWWNNLNDVLAWVKSGADFGFSQKDKKITLTGSGGTEADKQAKEATINTLVGTGHSIDNQMFVTLLTPAEPIAPPPEPKASLEPKAAPEPVQIEAAEVPACSSDMNVSISFNVNSAMLNAAGKKQLDQIAECLTTPTQVAGHTDNTGESSYNLMLSKLRAKAVIDYINATKPEKGKLLSESGFGEEKPIADNATRAGRAQNRRIEFIAK
ncbi:MAG: BON domain-containing protein [Gammaproteobacteria bacterium]|nr:BON domain-containing protein [Gammaproteobacteria bacterium]